MRLTKEQTLECILESEEVFALYSAVAEMVPGSDNKSSRLVYKNPMLMEAPVTRLMQVWMYDTNDACVEAAKKLVEKRCFGMSIRYVKENIRSLLMNIAECGADAIVFHKGGDSGEILLKEEKLQEIIDIKAPNDAQRELTRDVQYYWQMLHQNYGTKDAAPTNAEKEQERNRFNTMTGSLMRAGLYIPIVPDKEDTKKFAIPVLQEKDAEGNVKEKQILAFTNLMEVFRQFGQKVPQCKLCKLSELSVFLKGAADCIVINKATCAVRLNDKFVNSALAMQQQLEAVDKGEQELDGAAVRLHLNTDREIYTVYTASAVSVPNQEKPEIRLRNPYVIEDPESFNDQVWLYADKEDAQKAAQQIIGEKKMLAVVRVWRNKDFQHLLTTLASKAVNAIVYSKGGKTCEMELSDIVRLPDFSNVAENMRPIINPTLQLSALYYWQELCRSVPIKDRSEEEQQALMDRNAEFIANLRKSQFYIRYIQQERDGQLLSVFPMEVKKDANGQVVSAEHLIFSDIYELQRYFGDSNPKIIKVPFEKLADFLNAPCTGIILDPAGVDLHYSIDKMKILLGIQK